MGSAEFFGNRSREDSLRIPEESFRILEAGEEAVRGPSLINYPRSPAQSAGKVSQDS